MPMVLLIDHDAVLSNLNMTLFSKRYVTDFRLTDHLGLDGNRVVSYRLGHLADAQARCYM